jgi:hypothetical protein
LTEEATVKQIPCSTAFEFVSRLRITDELWGGQMAWDWGFRGQGDAKWPLLPSAFRPGRQLSYADAQITAPVPIPATPADPTQEWCEYKLIQHFLYLADRVGLGVPGDAQHFRLPPTRDSDRSFDPDEWPQPDVLETLAISQHHGVPTRLLDITHNALVAAFFAADDARDEKKVGNAERFGVWAVDLSLVRQAATLRVQTGQKPRLIHVTAPRADNSFLHHQDGLFLLDQDAGRRRREAGRFQPMDVAIEEIAQEVQTVPPDRLRYYRPCPASPMVMVTAPTALAMDVLDLLDREFYNRARIMPMHDNVVKSLEFHRSLNAHRKATGRDPAIYGVKY